MSRYGQAKLAELFANGCTRGDASNVRLTEVDGHTLIVGYGWAVYASRAPDGTITAYRGWHGYSPSTSSQLTKMGLSHPQDTSMDADYYEENRQRAHRFVDKAPELYDWSPEVAE